MAAVTHDGERGNTTTAPPASGAPAHTHGPGVWPILLTLCDPASCGLPGLPPPWPATNGTPPGTHQPVVLCVNRHVGSHCSTLPHPHTHLPHSTSSVILYSPPQTCSSHRNNSSLPPPTLPLLYTRVRWWRARPLGLHTLSVSQSHSGKDDLKATTCLG